MSNKKLTTASSTLALPSKKLTPELRTLLLKEELLSDQVVVSDELIQNIKDIGIPIELTSEQLAKLGSNKDKIKRILEALKWNWHDEYFDKLCDVFEAAFSPWIADELRIELQGENGTQQISEALNLENGRIVFKEFGHEKRLSELEKKRLHKLLNRKTQCTRDIWEKQLNRVNAKVDEETRRGNAIDDEAMKLAEEIRQFIAEHAGENFKSRAVTDGAQRTTDMFRSTPALKQFETQLNCLIQLTGQSRMETDNINDEKNRVIGRIEPESKPAVKPAANGLDIKLSLHFEFKKQSIIDCRQAIEDQRKLAEKLTEEIERAEKERRDILTEKQQLIDELTQRFEMKELENADTEHCIIKLSRELNQLQDQLNSYSDRASHLERGKRLQTIFSSATETNSGENDNNKKIPSSTSLPRIDETNTRTRSSRAKNVK